MLPLALIFSLALQQPPPPTPAAIYLFKVEAPKELIQAAEKGEVDKIRGFFHQAGFAGADSNGVTALIAAGESGQKAAFAEIITFLNEQARTTAVRLPREGQVAVLDLMTVVRVRTSLFSQPDKNGVTPLMHAARQGWDDLARLLLEGGAKTTALDGDGRSAADYADNAGYRALANTLREEPK